MRVFITGEAGFIAQNLPKAFAKVGILSVPVKGLKLRGTEPCVYSNSIAAWKQALADAQVDAVIHNAAVVGTDVVALDANESSLSNLSGTHTICRAAQELDIPVCYMGTTVIYDTAEYQNLQIREDSDRKPRTLYGIQKLAAENIVMTHCKKWLIMRPLFAYGGEGDMNSLIAKTFYSFHTDKTRKIDMFLDPLKYKDYLHVDDFCDAVAIACVSDAWNTDFNVSAETPLLTGEIVDIMSDAAGGNLKSCIKWHPHTDYLGNHRLSSSKFRRFINWTPKIPIEAGIYEAWESIKKAGSLYNPLKYLDQAAEKNIDLTKFY